MDFLQETLLPKFNYWIYVILMMIGLHAMIVKSNLLKKLIGMSIFQTAIILFFISAGVKKDVTIPILTHDQLHSHSPTELNPDEPAPPQALTVVNPDDFANPLPHVLMLTAIVVGVATLGVGLAVAQQIHHHYGTLEENVILEKIASDDG